MTGRNIKEGKGLVWGVREGGQSVAGQVGRLGRVSVLPTSRGGQG